MLEAWEAKLHADEGDAEARFEAAKDLAAIRGYRYLPAADVAKLPRPELFERLSKVKRKDGSIDKMEATALAGGAPMPPITLSRALDVYWTLAHEKTLGKSGDQVRRWRNPRIKAIQNLVQVIGNKPISEISADDMLDF